MLSFLPPLLRGIIASLILIINTLVLAPLLICIFVAFCLADKNRTSTLYDNRYWHCRIMDIG
jgi:ABC-type arginine/histidine transport system permease subunit